MSVEDRLTRMLKLLQGAIRASGLTQTAVDERIGRRRGYLSHVFQRRVDLKVADLLKVLAVLNLDPLRFFETATTHPEAPGPQEALAEDGRASSLDELMLLVSDYRHRARPEAWRQAPPSDRDSAELLGRVRSVVRRILHERAAHEGKNQRGRLRRSG